MTTNESVISGSISITPFELAHIRAISFGASLESFVQLQACLDAIEDARPEERKLLEAVLASEYSDADFN